ncbi:MAG: hypothetical protein IT432_09350 [Phycisphaerales bacterium]|nr:hypothetical protein [Phycisphaerales bacterium]
MNARVDSTARTHSVDLSASGWAGVRRKSVRGGSILRKAGKTSIALGVLALLGGFTLHAETCCEKDLCSNVRFLQSQIARSYQRCCNLPADQQDTCLISTNDKIMQTEQLILAAKIACDNGDDELARDIIRQLKDLWLPKPKATASGAVLNEMIALGKRDWVNLDMAMARSPAPCQPVTVGIVDGQVVNAEATGAATEETPEAVTSGAGLATVVPSTGPLPMLTCEYQVPAGTSMGIRFGEEFPNLGMVGSISIVKLATAFPESGVAKVGPPTNVHFQVSALWGASLALDLDKSSAYNKLEVDSAGNGTLGVALNLTSTNLYLSGLVQVGSTIYFTFQVTVAADWSTIRIHADPTMPGNTITPTFPEVLAVDDIHGAQPAGGDRCADENGSGIPDGADEEIAAMNTVLGCNSQH